MEITLFIPLGLGLHGGDRRIVGGWSDDFCQAGGVLESLIIAAHCLDIMNKRRKTHGAPIAPIRPIVLLLLALLMGSSVGLARDQDRPFIDEPSSDRTNIDEGEAWTEQGVVVPPYPLDEDLTPFEVDDLKANLRYFIDRRNLQVGDDGVVRYTLVIRSASGGNNVSFEGLRCNVREYQIYAYGSGRGVMKPTKKPQWKKVRLSGPYTYRRDLREYYFCKPGQWIPYDKAEIIRRLGLSPASTEGRDFY